MSRLTGRFSNGQTYVVGCGVKCKYGGKYCDPYTKDYLQDCPTLGEIFDKLAYYEDLEDEGKLKMYKENECDNKCDNKYDDDYYEYDDDCCYECGGYGDDYSVDENGELICNCENCSHSGYGEYYRD